LEAVPNRLGQEKNLINCGTTRSKPAWIEEIRFSEAIENQALEEFGYTGGERNWTIGGWKVGRFTEFVYRDNGGKFPA